MRAFPVFVGAWQRSCVLSRSWLQHKHRKHGEKMERFQFASGSMVLWRVQAGLGGDSLPLSVVPQPVI